MFFPTFNQFWLLLSLKYSQKCWLLNPIILCIHTGIWLLAFFAACSWVQFLPGSLEQSNSKPTLPNQYIPSLNNMS